MPQPPQPQPLMSSRTRAAMTIHQQQLSPSKKLQHAIVVTSFFISAPFEEPLTPYYYAVSRLATDFFIYAFFASSASLFHKFIPFISPKEVPR